MKVYNTLSRQQEEFLPRNDEVKMYVCGVTPYDHSHIGHAMSYIIFDVIIRYLTFRGYSVKYVQNITDIDDKIIDRANNLGVSTNELAEKYISSYFEDMDALNIVRSGIYPRATKEIPKIVEVVQCLIDKGYAYPARGSVYFRVRNVSDYGKLSHRSLESMMTVSRIEAGEEKEHPMDFVLWKASKPGEPEWASPWGPGRPGWHIECSAMSLKYLGEALDIHGGGQDLIFPHHENEIAQSEGFTGTKPFVKYWLHNGLLQLGEDKMSKSLGNLITIKEALEKYNADAIRIFVLSSHYRNPLTYSEVTLEAADVGLQRLIEAKYKERDQYAEMNRSILEARGEKTDNIVPADVYSERFITAMDGDFHTPQAIATLFDLASEINRAFNLGHEVKVLEHHKLFIELTDLLGLILQKPTEDEFPLDTKPFTEVSESTIAQLKKEKLEYILENVSTDPNAVNAEGYINYLIGLRNALRKANRFHLADEIRSKLEKLGITLEDTPKGTVWKRKR
ncbi:cysteine--tRNA ligase [Chloroflexota bacterium]